MHMTNIVSVFPARPAVAALLALLVTGPIADPAVAQATRPDEPAAIDELFRWVTADSPGCVVAVSHHGKQVVDRAYGLADLEREVALDTTSLFDVGSLRKQFIAAAVLVLVEDGKLALSDDARKHVPELPDYGHTITLDHLLTHTSGIRDWTGILPLTGGTADVLPLILRQRGLNFRPGDEWSYSNSGYVLLKEIVTRTSGMSFADFARKRLFEPLGMTSTTYQEDLRAVAKNRALGYEKKRGAWETAMLLDNDRGGGGALLSTAGDLLLWNDALTNNRLGASVTDRLHEPAKLNNGRQLRYARGLIVEPFRAGGMLVWHSGGAAGYHSFLGRMPAHGLSIAVLCNSDAMPATAIARRIADQFLPAAGASTAEAKPPAAPDGAGVGVSDLTDKAGVYFSERTGEPLRLVVDDSRLRVAGGPPLAAVARDRFRNPRGDLFFMSQDEFELRFLSREQLELKSMEGATTRYRRAEPYAPTADDLKAFAGRYECDEIGSVIQILPRAGGVVMRLDLSPQKALDLAPVDRDAFQVARMTVRFHRDASGTVVGLDYSNPLVRNIRFTRRRDSRLPPVP
jgi:CubicO group peptidase (beta-lactamase class C family)